MKKLMLILTVAFAILISQTTFAQDKPPVTKSGQTEMKAEVKAEKTEKKHRKSEKKVKKDKKEHKKENKEEVK